MDPREIHRCDYNFGVQHCEIYYVYVISPYKSEFQRYLQDLSKQTDGLVGSRIVFSKGKRIMRGRARTYSQPELPLEDCLERLITNWNRRHSKIQRSLAGIPGLNIWMVVGAQLKTKMTGKRESPD